MLQRESEHEERESRRSVQSDTFEMLRPYFREIAPVETLTAEQEVALSKRVDAHTAGLRQEIFGIPFAARFVVEHWNALRDAERVPAYTPASAQPARLSPSIGQSIGSPRVWPRGAERAFGC